MLGRKEKTRTTTAEIHFLHVVNYAARTHLLILLLDLEVGIFGIQDTWTKILWRFTKMLASYTDVLRGSSQIPAPGTSADTSS